MSLFPLGDNFRDDYHRPHQVDLTVSVPPSAEPVSIDQLKAHCRIDATDDQDPLLPVFISSARERAEAFCRRTFPVQTLVLTLDRFPGRRVLYLRRPPVRQVLSVTYLDPVTGARVTMDPATYGCDLDYNAPRLFPTQGNCWPQSMHQPGNVQITYTAGYMTLPASAVHAILLMAADGYENRGAQLEATRPVLPNPTAENLLYPLRTFEGSV